MASSWWLIGLLATIGIAVTGGPIRSVQNDGGRIAVPESQIQDAGMRRGFREP